MTLRRPTVPPGTLLHLFNRGAGQRSIFESARHIAYAHEKLSLEVQSAHVKVRAYSAMTNHWHWLVETMDVPVGDVVRRVFSPHVRRFNRDKDRQGQLFSRAFGMVVIKDEWHAQTALRYVDQNPAAAGIVPHASLYPYCTPHGHALGVLPDFVDKQALSELLGVPFGDRKRWAAAYESKFGQPMAPELFGLMQLREKRVLASRLPFDDLLGAAPERIQEWFEHRAAVQDSPARALPFCSTARLARTIARFRRERGPWGTKIKHTAIDLWELCHAGLLVDACGLTQAEAAKELGIRQQAVCVCVRRYRRFLTDTSFADTAVDALRTACEWGSFAEFR